MHWPTVDSKFKVNYDILANTLLSLGLDLLPLTLNNDSVPSQ